MEKELANKEAEEIDWNQQTFTEKQIIEATLNSKIDKLMNLTSPAAVNTAVEKLIEDWLIEELEKSGAIVIEDNEVL